MAGVLRSASRGLLYGASRRPIVLRGAALADKAYWKLRLYASARDFPRSRLCDEREDMYDELVRTRLGGGDAPIDFLEFGVYRGESLRWWSERCTHPDARFVGFDSFVGLPEDWTAERRKGSFTTNGATPHIADPRVTFCVGWFQDSLPSFAAGFSPHHRLVIHCDADLYSSTIYALAMLDRFITAGTIVIFDEFYDARHEFRALLDYCAGFRRRYRLIAATKTFEQAAVEII